AGIDRLLQCMEDEGFYAIHPHSHHRYEGGLAAHALGVCKRALKHCGDLPRDSVILCALLHDICDIRGREQLAKGHGGFSAQILSELGLPLTDGERCAIRNHMRRADHHNAHKRISSTWASVMADPANRHLQQLIYRCDKDDARHR
ncbi:MAG: HD domain-containing protein, partial [Synergistes sp.]|nr:HD domain-containing protein [Synergistes sp.]